MELSKTNIINFLRMWTLQVRRIHPMTSLLWYQKESVRRAIEKKKKKKEARESGKVGDVMQNRYKDSIAHLHIKP